MQVIKNNIILSNAYATFADFAYPVYGLCACSQRHSYYLLMNVPDEGYSRTSLCTSYSIPTFLLLWLDQCFCLLIISPRDYQPLSSHYFSVDMVYITLSDIGLTNCAIRFTCSERLSNYLDFQSVDYERIWWEPFQKWVVRAKLYIYVLIYV